MKNTFKTLILAIMIAGSLNSLAQTEWSLTGNNISNTIPPPAPLKLGTLDASDLPFYTNDAQRMTLTANGWLGIGTQQPNGMQEIRYCPTVSNAKNGLVVTLDNCTQPSHSFLNLPDVIGPGIVINPFTEGSVFAPPVNFLTGNITNVSAPLFNNTSPLFWVRQEFPQGKYAQNSGEPEYETNFIVLPDGSCGVNIAQPRAAMDIRGSNKANFPAAIIGARAFGFNPQNSNGLVQYHTQQVQFVPVLKTNGYNQITQNGDQGMFFTDGKGVTASNTKDGSNENGAFILAPWASQGNSDIGGMRMDANGNTEFHGTLRATKMNVDAKWWADFVFDADYKLMSLGELEQYIQTNKHLPNVPSEEEVIENGIDVANMQAIQQQKIEELTLYIIQLKKEMDAMQAALESLK
jgi:hypothetical protein